MSEPHAVNMAHGRNEEQKAVMAKIIEQNIDPFDWELLAEHHREPVLKKGLYWVVTRNDYPYPGSTLHLLLIYRDRVRKLHEVHPDAFAELQEMLAWIEQEFDLTHGAFLMRFGETALTAASVDHLHAHIVVGGTEAGDAKLKVSVGYMQK